VVLGEGCGGVHKDPLTVIARRCRALAPVADWLRNPAVQSAAAMLDPVWRAEVDRLVPSDKGQGKPGAGLRAMVDAW
jgi:hypothetical protein